MSAELRRFLASDKFLAAAKKKVEAAIQETNDGGLPKAYNDSKQNCEVSNERKSTPRSWNKPK